MEGEGRKRAEKRGVWCDVESFGWRGAFEYGVVARIDWDWWCGGWYLGSFSASDVLELLVANVWENGYM